MNACPFDVYRRYDGERIACFGRYVNLDPKEEVEGKAEASAELILTGEGGGAVARLYFNRAALFNLKEISIKDEAMDIKYGFTLMREAIRLS